MIDAAPPTPEEIDRLARCLWVHDGLPRAWFDNEPGTPESLSVGGVVADMRATYRRDAAKMLVILQQGGNFDAE